MDDDKSDYGSTEPNPRKRSYSNRTATYPQLSSYRPMQFSSLPTPSTRAPMAPSASLNRNFPPPPPIQRWHGDGLDLRRPVISQGNQASQAPQTPAIQELQQPDVIDLTSDDETAMNTTPEFTPAIERLRLPVMTARTPEVIDLDDDDDANEVIFERAVHHSPEIEFVSSRPRTDLPPPRPPTPPGVHARLGSSWFAGVDLPRLDTFGVGSRLGRYGTAFLGGRTRIRSPTFPDEEEMFGVDADFTIDPLPRAEWQFGPIGMDYGRVPFNMGPADLARPATAISRVEPPDAAPDGYTRAPTETDVVVCQKCDRELGTGDTPEQRQIWAMRRCGHCYCGECINARKNGNKRVVMKCIAPGCTTVIKSSKSAMTMLYI